MPNGQSVWAGGSAYEPYVGRWSRRLARKFLDHLGQFPAPDYAMSLSEYDRVQLRERIREALPIKHDGSIELIARAWAVQGTR